MLSKTRNKARDSSNWLSRPRFYLIYIVEVEDLNLVCARLHIHIAVRTPSRAPAHNIHVHYHLRVTVHTIALQDAFDIILNLHSPLLPPFPFKTVKQHPCSPALYRNVENDRLPSDRCSQWQPARGSQAPGEGE
eukprot:1200444-Rhodomonas_salina.2